ncbi:hypothetical protein G9A89_019592 [Geosiphon pyriformis]|nr:hypothetical protein G9A89_019592 [Geosiphon pyriformis]
MLAIIRQLKLIPNFNSTSSFSGQIFYKTILLQPQYKLILCKRTSSLSKRRRDAAINPIGLTLREAMAVIKACEIGKPQSTYELHIQCKREKGTQPIRGSVVLPKTITQDSFVMVFATGEKAREAKEAGARLVGGEELVDKIANGEIKLEKINHCFSTPDVYPHVQKIARALGSKGLMPMEKRGTVTNEIASVVKGSMGKFEFKTDKHQVLHVGIGKLSYTPKELEDNIFALCREMVAIAEHNNQTGRIIRKIVLNSTQGPGIPLLDIPAVLEKERKNKTSDTKDDTWLKENFPSTELDPNWQETGYNPVYGNVRPYKENYKNTVYYPQYWTIRRKPNPLNKRYNRYKDNTNSDHKYNSDNSKGSNKRLDSF